MLTALIANGKNFVGKIKYLRASYEYVSINQSLFISDNAAHRQQVMKKKLHTDKEIRESSNEFEYLAHAIRLYSSSNVPSKLNQIVH